MWLRSDVVHAHQDAPACTWLRSRLDFALLRLFALEQIFEEERDERKHAQDDGRGECGRRGIFLVAAFHEERERLCPANNVSRNDADRTKLAHRARIREHDAIKESPSNVWERHIPEHLKLVSAERSRRLFVAEVRLLEQWNEFLGDEGQRDEERREHHARQREDYLEAEKLEYGRVESVASVEEHEHESHNDRADREGQIEERDHRALARELISRDVERTHDAEDGVERHGNARADERHLDRLEKVVVNHGGEEGPWAIFEGLDEDVRQRQNHDEEHPHEGQCDEEERYWRVDWFPRRGASSS